ADFWNTTVVGLVTVTVTAADVVMFPAASRACAVTACVPFGTSTEFQDVVYGLAVNSAPRFAPSTLNCTPTTPTSSAAVAASVTAAPLTAAPSAGAVIAIAGGVTSPEAVESKTTSIQ